MAFNNGFPVTYQPAFYGQANPYYQQLQNTAMMQQAQQMQQTQQSQPQQMQQTAIQNSGFVVVPSESEVRSYPVAPGNSITFKIENAPVCYVKTMGFSQLESPTIERYRLVKEDMPDIAKNAPKIENSTQDSKDTAYALKSDLTAIWGEIETIKEKIKTNTEKKPAKTKLIDMEEMGDDE